MFTNREISTGNIGLVLDFLNNPSLFGIEKLDEEESTTIVGRKEPKEQEEAKKEQKKEQKFGKFNLLDENVNELVKKRGKMSDTDFSFLEDKDDIELDDGFTETSDDFEDLFDFLDDKKDEAEVEPNQNQISSGKFDISFGEFDDNEFGEIEDDESGLFTDNRLNNRFDLSFDEFDNADDIVSDDEFSLQPNENTLEKEQSLSEPSIIDKPEETLGLADKVKIQAQTSVTSALNLNNMIDIEAYIEEDEESDSLGFDDEEDELGFDDEEEELGFDEDDEEDSDDTLGFDDEEVDDSIGFDDEEELGFDDEEDSNDSLGFDDEEDSDYSIFEDDEEEDAVPVKTVQSKSINQIPVQPKAQVQQTQTVSVQKPAVNAEVPKPNQPSQKINAQVQNQNVYASQSLNQSSDREAQVLEEIRLLELDAKRKELQEKLTEEDKPKAVEQRLSKEDELRQEIEILKLELEKKKLLEQIENIGNNSLTSENKESPKSETITSKTTFSDNMQKENLKFFEKSEKGEVLESKGNENIKQEIPKVNTFAKKEQPKKVVKKKTPEEIRAEKHQRYSEMPIHILYGNVRKFMSIKGVKGKPLSIDVLTTEFGKNNIKKLISKGYLIKFKEGVTIGR